MFASLVVVACSGGETVDLGGSPLHGAENANDTEAPKQEEAPVTSSPTTPAAPQGPASQGPQPGFSFQATASSSVPAGARLAVLWVVSSGSPDYMYAFGSVASSGPDVYVTFSTEPPPDALNAGNLGVGFLVAVTANVSEGKILTEAALGDILARSYDDAIIFRASTAQSYMESGWDASFPQGFSCGRCVHTGAIFDDFEPQPCDQVKLDPITDGRDGCNWT